jgi:hypothetical protein
VGIEVFWLGLAHGFISAWRITPANPAVDLKKYHDARIIASAQRMLLKVLLYC